MSHRTKRRTIIASVLGVAAVGGVVAGGAVAYDRLAAEDVAIQSEPEISTASAEVRTLAVDYEASGSLEYETSIAVAAPAAGTVTAVAAAGTVLSSGDVIAVVDDVPVVWLDGDVPAWRTMADGDVGDDVAQLESALDTLGFNGDADVTIDDEYTSATAAMVEEWQETIGAPVTGRVEFGSVVFGGDRSRVAAVSAVVGGAVAADAELLSLGSTVRLATFEIPPADAVTLSPGEQVLVRLPDRSVVDAVVDRIDRAVDVWSVTATFGQVDLPVLDVVDVDVAWEREAVVDRLTIPSSALLRLDDGTYVVDVMTADSVERRTVEIGSAVGTRVVVEAGLADGDIVVVL